MKLMKVIVDLQAELQPLCFGPPVTHVYNPLIYAKKPHDEYLKAYGGPPKEVLFVGMNPGPWGMAQTGVPFGEVHAVKDWLGVAASVNRPKQMHPKRPVTGFDCTRSEVSGRRLWNWAKKSFGTPELFFARFFVTNYCPLLFLESTGRNRTPNNLPAEEKKPLFMACDRALRRTVEFFGPRYVVGIGRFAEDRARSALAGIDVRVGCITHPSPANPKANRGWEPVIEQELSDLGIRL